MLIWRRIVAVLLMVCVWAVSSTRAQVLPVLNYFQDRRFDKMVYVSWPVLFEGCTFVTDSVVLSCSYGAVFKDCTIESRSGVLYMCESGDGIIMSDCEVLGCNDFSFARLSIPSHINYLSQVNVNGHGFDVSENDSTIVEMDGLMLIDSLEQCYDLFNTMLVTSIYADKQQVHEGDSVKITLRGVRDGMFIGWHSEDPDLSLCVTDAPNVCMAFVRESITDNKRVLVRAYSEYGLEEAVVLDIIKDELNVITESGVKERKRMSRKKR